MLLPEADTLAAHALEQIRATLPDLRELSVTGRLRRGAQTIDEVAIVAVSGDAHRWPRMQFIAKLGVRLIVCDPAHRGVALLCTTGSQGHLQDLQALAARRGLRLDDSGLRKGPREILCSTEQELYAALGLPFIEPELREGSGEVELALRGALPALLTEKQVQGALHNHTVLSDGRETLEQMAQAARAKGLTYLGIADHFCGLEALEQQRREADSLNLRWASEFRIFTGLEVDIQADGSLDLPAQLPPSVDYVVCGIHDHLSLDRAAQTARLIRAIRHPHTFMLSHPTGRLLPGFDGIDVDLEAVLRASASFGVVVEINANPRRLDLDWRWHQRAVELGCLLSISPDAHSASELDFLRWGILAARKSALAAKSLLSCADADYLDGLFQAKRRRISRL
ncbi:MAG TPA: DNA polymerase/3'-5' exonuclease PolX [Planctomycetota bacterium]|jgi:DNA polymerase (family 10)